MKKPLKFTKDEIDIIYLLAWQSDGFYCLSKTEEELEAGAKKIANKIYKWRLKK